MSLDIATAKANSFLKSQLPEACSHIFAELLDPNHDAWSITRRHDTWSFYREVGGDKSSFPNGAVVLKTRPGETPTLDLYYGRKTHSLTEGCRSEIPKAINLLFARERSIALFNGLACTKPDKIWNHSLAFCEDRVTRRFIQLRPDTAEFAHFTADIGSSLSLDSFGAHTTLQKVRSSYNQFCRGLFIEQQDEEQPAIQHTASFRSPMLLSFSSNRLVPGIRAITDRLACMVTASNRLVKESMY
jgi:hypothetical protein